MRQHFLKETRLEKKLKITWILFNVIESNANQYEVYEIFRIILVFTSPAIGN